MVRSRKREEREKSDSYSDDSNTGDKSNSSSESSLENNEKKRHYFSSKKKRIKKKHRSSSKTKKHSRKKEVFTSNSDTSSSFSSDDDSSSLSKRKRNIKKKKRSSSSKKKKSKQDVFDINSVKTDKQLDKQIKEGYDQRKKHIQKSFEYLSELKEFDYNLFTVHSLTNSKSKFTDFFKNICDSYPKPPNMKLFSSKSLSESTVPKGILKNTKIRSTYSGENNIAIS